MQKIILGTCFTLMMSTPLCLAAEIQPTIKLPTAGMSMQRVYTQYGAPKTKHNPIGHPPITQWDYVNFSVYFEHSHVVHSLQRMSLPKKITVIIDAPTHLNNATDNPNAPE